MSDATPNPPRPPVLPYVGPLARHGAVVEQGPDRLRVIVPPRPRLVGSLLARWVVGPDRYRAWMVRGADPDAAFALVRPRATVTVADGQLTVWEYDGDGSAARSWPLAAVGERRPNRYCPTLYVRVPGEEVADVLAGVHPDVIRGVTELVEQYLQAVRGEAGPTVDGGRPGV